MRLSLTQTQKEQYKYTPEVTPEQVLNAANEPTGIRLLDLVGTVIAEVPMTLSGKVAEALQMDTNELNIMVRNLCGVGVRELLDAHLLQKAKRLIEEAEELNVIQVAKECGFSGGASFGTFFERKTGKTPLEWKTGKKPYNWHRP